MSENQTKIILVEDDLFLAKMYEKKFSQEGFSLKIFASAEPAIKEIKKDKPDLVLLDILLPGKLNGFAILKNIKEDDSTKNIPVVMLSNFSGGEEVKKAKDLGADDYIIKIELTPSEVIEKIKKMLKK
ncbi:response regulator [bacterium]|nr:response regulator [bacterium]